MKVKIFVCMVLFFGFLKAEKCNSPVEMAIIVDTSDNLAASDFRDVQGFINKVGNIFHISPHATHASVILAGDSVTVPINFKNSGANRKKFSKSVNAIKDLGGSWSLDRALAVAKDNVFTSNNGVRNFLPHIAIVITSGKQGEGSRDQLSAAARELREKKVNVYAIGVGERTSFNELRSMVEEGSHVYQFETFKGLVNAAPKVARDICRDTAGSLGICTIPIDVGFIIDSSGSISTKGYANIKNFLKGISVFMGFQPGKVHVGAVLYSKEAEVALKFGKQPHLRKLFRLISGIPHRRDRTRIDLGLKMANVSLFSRNGGMREDVKKIAILLTDGKQTTENVNDLIPLNEAAAALLRRNITIFAVGIGDDVDIKELRDIVENEEQIIVAKTFAELEKKVVKIATVTCKEAVGVKIDFTKRVYDVKESDKNAVIEIAVKSGQATTPVTIDLTTTSATAGKDDFEGIKESVTFQPGETGPKSVEINLIDDLIVEPTEAFNVSLTSSSPVNLGAPAIVNIIDDDVPPAVINFTQSVYSADEDKKAVLDIVVTSGNITSPVVVSVNPAPSTAGSDDFVEVTKNVTFQPGETGPKSVEFDLVDDLIDEPIETFTASLSSPSPVILGEPASVNIIDNDEPVISFTKRVYDVREDEIAVVDIKVTSGQISTPVTISVTTDPLTAGTGDFVKVNKTVTFQPGETGPKSVKINLVDDALVEPAERFSVFLNSSSPVKLGDAAAVNILDNDDPLITFTKRVYNVNEDEKAVVDLEVMSGPIITPVTVSVGTAPVTADINDFVEVRKSVVFQPGETGPKSVEIDLIDDALVEPTERFSVFLNSPSPVMLGDPGVVNIIDNDEPVISFKKRVYDVKENEKAVVDIEVASGPVVKPVTVSVITSPNTAGRDDFIGVKKNVTFQPQESGPKSVEIDLVDDFLVEPTESFLVTLNSSSPVTLGDPALVNILDNDVVINFTQPVYNVDESEKAVVGIAITSGKVIEPIKVYVTPETSTAKTKDFSAKPKSVTFEPEETGPKFIEIDVTDDHVDEPTEVFTVYLSSSPQVILGDPASVNIIDNDEPPICETEKDVCHKFATCTDTGPRSYNCTCNEGYTGDGKYCAGPVIEFMKRVYHVKENEKPFIEVAVASGQVTVPVTIGVTPILSTAGKEDFAVKTDSITFQPGETGPKPVLVDLIDDSLVEPGEMFQIGLNASSPAVTVGPAASVNIIDNDEPSICDSEKDVCHQFATCLDTGPGSYNCTCKEGYFGDGKHCEVVAIDFTKLVYDANENETAVVEVVVTSGEITTPMTVGVSTSVPSAGNRDFIPTRVNVTFLPGEKGPKPVKINLIDDADVEPVETFTVSLESLSPVTVGEPATVKIIDNDVPKVCGSEKDDCHRFATCIDTGPGSYQCTCNEGYTGDGKTCKGVVVNFTSRVYNVNENEKAVVEVELASGPATKPITVGLATKPSSAGHNDFVPLSKNVTFQPGEIGPKSVMIDLNDDLDVEPTEAFTVFLTSLLPIRLGQKASVNIIDNDGIDCALDIGFLVDSTGSMRNCNFKKEKDFVKEIAGYFQIAPGASRTSVIVYSDKATLTKTFKDNATETLKGFKADVDKLPFQGGAAHLDKALQLAASTMFTAENGMRSSEIPKVLIILNDGTQTALAESAKETSSLLQENGIRIVVVGVGEADAKLLGQIVASPKDLIMVDKFEDAKESLTLLSRQFCPPRDPSACQALQQTMDVKIGGCVSKEPVKIGVCNGECPSDSQFVKQNDVYELPCACCKPKTKVMKTVVLNCRENTTQAFQISEARSCACDSCENKENAVTTNIK